MEKQRKEIPIIVEGPQPIGYHLLELVAKSQEITLKQFGASALAVYKLPNRFNESSDGTA